MYINNYYTATAQRMKYVCVFRKNKRRTKQINKNIKWRIISILF